MNIEVEMLQPRFCNYVTQALSKGFLSHAYLIETANNSEEVIKEAVLFFVKKIYEKSYENSEVLISKEKLFHLLDLNEFPDYIEVKPINNQIKKEQLLQIKNDFSNKSLYNTFKIYVVYECDRMNVNSANTILKFLEEPSENIIALFITSNRYNVLDTIRSRCQILSLENHRQKVEIENQILEEFVSNIKNRKKDNLMLKFNYYNNELFKDKKESISNLKILLEYYKYFLDNNESLDLSLNELISIISIMEDALQKLKYNVNMKLWLDDFFLSLMEVDS